MPTRLSRVMLATYGHGRGTALCSCRDDDDQAKDSTSFARCPPLPAPGTDANGWRCSPTHATVEVHHNCFGHPYLRSSVYHPNPLFRQTEIAVRRNNLWPGKINGYFFQTRTVFQRYWVEEPGISQQTIAKPRFYYHGGTSRRLRRTILVNSMLGQTRLSI